MYIPIRFFDFSFCKMGIYLYFRDFLFMYFFLIYKDFLLDLFKITGWNPLISNGNGISTYFSAKKWYISPLPSGKNITQMIFFSNFFSWAVEISFLHTKVCGNAPYNLHLFCTKGWCCSLNLSQIAPFEGAVPTFSAPLKKMGAKNVS